MKRAILIPLLFMLSLPAYAGQTYDDTIAARECSEGYNQLLSCRYKVGKGLDFEIAGIGAPDTAITFYSANFESGYYATFGIMHQCVIVKHKGFTGGAAFVSPANGKVYSSWPECKDGF